MAVAEEAAAELPRRHQTGRSVEEHDVPVGLGAGRHDRRLVRAEQPDRVDREQPAQQRDHREHDHREAGRLDGERREHPDADHVVLCPAGAGPLRVLLLDQ